MDLGRIRNAIRDLDSSEVAPRLNAQVRLREEHVEMLQFLLKLYEDEFDRRNSAAARCRCR